MNKQEIKQWLDEMGIEKYIINENLCVDVDTSVDLKWKNLTQIPVKFWHINGDFDCSRNQLTSLLNCPIEVTGHFICGYNQLQTLNGCTQKIGGAFFCHDNELISLIGGPQEVGKDYWLAGNKIKSLKGCPEIIDGDFQCAFNHLTSFEYCPKIVKNQFGSVGNQIQTLNFFPESMGDIYFQQDKIFFALKCFYDSANTIEMKGDIFLKYVKVAALQEHLNDTLGG